MIIDLHVHTTRGASCSSLAPLELAAEAKRMGLEVVCVTEHDRTWERTERDRFSAEHGLVLLRGMEVTTDLGHVIAFGLDSYVAGINKARELRRVADGVGGYLVAVHPFRYAFVQNGAKVNGERWKQPPTLEEAAETPLLGLVDAIESLNGGCTDEENAFALQVAKLMGKPTTGGSDAHSHNGLCCYTTAFETAIGSEQEFLRELHAGRFYAATGFREGKLAPYRL